MAVELGIVIGTTVYKLACLAVGSLSCLLGYRLFKAGIWGSSGDVTAKFLKTSLVVKNAAPGTFFAIVGALIICFTVYKGLGFTLEGTTGSSHTRRDAPPPPVPEPKGENK